jgi:hypothetical protein
MNVSGSQDPDITCRSLDNHWSSQSYNHTTPASQQASTRNLCCPLGEVRPDQQLRMGVNNKGNNQQQNPCAISQAVTVGIPGVHGPRESWGYRSNLTPRGGLKSERPYPENPGGTNSGPHRCHPKRQSSPFVWTEHDHRQGNKPRSAFLCSAREITVAAGK